jgi:hypothetical protein
MYKVIAIVIIKLNPRGFSPQSNYTIHIIKHYAMKANGEVEVELQHS